MAAARILAVLFGLTAILFTSVPAVADRTERISFAAGRTSKTVSGTISGYDGVDYLVRVGAGQRLAVSMRTDNDSSYFNVLAPGNPTALFNGSISGDSSDIIVPDAGDYRIQVYLMRNAARRNETARFTLAVEVTGGPPPAEAAGQPDFADGLAGGPDFWAVANLEPGDRLNLRSRPTAKSEIVARLPEGTVLRNLGCRMNGQTRWCRVERPDGSVGGWAAGRYLVESGG